MEYSYKFRIYPNVNQEYQIVNTFGCCRFIFNYYLDLRRTVYERTSGVMNYYACSNDLTQLKKHDNMQWLNAVDSSALQSSLRDLDNSYKNFFRRVKRGENPGYPKFKNKKCRRQSYRSQACKGNIKVIDNAIKLPKLGLVKCRVSTTVKGKILSATISKTASGKYFVSLCCRLDEEIEKLPSTGAVIGFDVGIKSFAVSSDGIEYENPKYLSRSEKKLAKLQRQLSRKTKDSSNWNKARIKVARLHEHIHNQRNDMQHKLSTQIIREYDIVCIEDLAPKNMARNHKLAKSILDASWGEFRRQLMYKADWYGKKVVCINRFYPSSQLCSECGAQWSGTKDLKIRKWVCPNCGANLDRDTNAAINILHEGMRMLA